MSMLYIHVRVGFVMVIVPFFYDNAGLPDL